MTTPRQEHRGAPPPPLLVRLYGKDRVQPLHHVLLNLSALSTRAARLSQTLIQPQDHPDYLQLLRNTYCIVNSSAPPLYDGFSLQQNSTQLELLNKAIESLLQISSGNVLCLGYRKSRPSLSGQMVQGAPHTECHAHSSIAAALQDPTWQLLLSRIGDTLMLYILLHSSLYRKLANNCCLQLSGRPVAELAKAWKTGVDAQSLHEAVVVVGVGTGSIIQRNDTTGLTSTVVGFTSTTTHQQGGTGGAGPTTTVNNNNTTTINMNKRKRPGGLDDVQEEEQEEEEEDSVDCIVTQNPSSPTLVVPAAGGGLQFLNSIAETARRLLPTNSLVFVAAAAAGEHEDGQQQHSDGDVDGSREQCIKKGRPSSWQRKKAKKLAAAAAAIAEREQQQQQTEITTVSSLPTTVNADELPPSLSPLSQQQQPQTLTAPLQINTNNTTNNNNTDTDMLDTNYTTVVDAALDGEDSLPPTQPQEEEEHLNQQQQQATNTIITNTTTAATATNIINNNATTTTNNVVVGGNNTNNRTTEGLVVAKAYSPWPRFTLKPSNMTIRRSILYSATFSKRPGWPAQHLLSKIKGNPQAAHILYASIFSPIWNPTTRRSKKGERAAYAVLPPPATHIPPKHNHLLPLLQSLVDRAVNCPYGVLLNQYCPLPASIRRSRANATELGDRNVVLPENVDLGHVDMLMDELFQLEQQEKQQNEQQQEPASGGSVEQSGRGTTKTNNKNNKSKSNTPPAAPVPTSKDGSSSQELVQKQHHPNKRSKTTGLQRLVATADVNLKNASNGSQPVVDTMDVDTLGAATAGGGGGGVPIPILSTDIPTNTTNNNIPSQIQQQQQQLLPQQQQQNQLPQQQSISVISSVPLSPYQQQQLQQQSPHLTMLSTYNAVQIGQYNRPDMSPISINNNINDNPLVARAARPLPPTTTTGNNNINNSNIGGIYGVVGGGIEGTSQQNHHQNIDDQEAARLAKLAQATAEAQTFVKDTQPLLACFVPHAEVTDFIWAVLRRIIPRQLLGDASARVALKGAIRKFVGLRRWEQMTVHQAMQGVPISGLSWLSSSSSSEVLGSVNGVEEEGGQQQQQQQIQREERREDEQMHDGVEGNNNTEEERTKKKGSVPPNLAAARQRWLSLWIGWVFSVLVVPLLRNHFYCTESEAYRHQVFYYRKPVWARLTAAYINHLRHIQFTAISANEAQRILSQRRLGVAKLRLLPKRNGMRFIINMGKPSKVIFKEKFASSSSYLPHQNNNNQRRTTTAGGVGVSRFLSTTTGGARGNTTTTRHIYTRDDGGNRLQISRQRTELSFVPVNRMLQSLYQVLKFEAARQPHALGSSVFGYNDVYCKLQPFIRRLKAARGIGDTTNGTGTSAGGIGSIGTSDLYFVSVDVSGAFDHLDLDTLLSVVEPLLQCEQYLILKYQEVVPNVGSIRVVQRRVAVPGHSALPFTTLASQWSEKFRNKTFTDQVVYDSVSKVEMLALLRQHLNRNLVRLRRQWHFQSRGIAQGSTLGTLLCQLYLAHVEKTKVLPVIAQASGMGHTVFAPLPLSSPSPSAWQPPVGGTDGGGGVVGGHTMSGSYQQQQQLQRGSIPEAATAATTSRGGITALAYAACAMPLTHNHHNTNNIPAGYNSSSHLGQHHPGNNANAGGRFMMHQYQVSSHNNGGMGGVSFFSEYSTRSSAGGSLLFRLVDDWFLVTEHAAVAHAVAGKLLEGFPEFNVVVNPVKTKLSFPLTLADGSILPPSLFTTRDGSRFIKWCGLLLNVDTLEIQADYTRYVGEHIDSSLTVPLGSKPGSKLAEKLCFYLRPKIHPLLLDSCINSPDTIRRNIYQAFLLAAMKFHCYVRSLPARPAPGTTLLPSAIMTGINFMCKYTSTRRVGSLQHGLPSVTCHTVISKIHIKYLGLYAFKEVLLRKQTAYKDVLQFLDAALAESKIARCAKQLESVVDPLKSAIFDDIIY